MGSTAVTTDLEGVRTGEVRYMPWGEDRYTYGTTPTTMRYTGQRQEESLGLYFYGARWYDPALGRWIQPDPIIPEAAQGTQAWDRFAYVNNSPINLIDPTGNYGKAPNQITKYSPLPTPQYSTLYPNYVPSLSATPTPYQVTPTRTSLPGTPTSTPTPTGSPTDYHVTPTNTLPATLTPPPTPSMTPTATPPSLESTMPLCETNGIDAVNLTMDVIGLNLDLLTLEGGRAINTIQFSYSIAEIGVDLENLDSSNDNDWYDYTSLILDFFGMGIPYLPDLTSIYLNQVHSEQCVEE